MLVIKLALKDLLFEKYISLCTIISLCAIICPLLILYSLRFGVISTLQNNLITNPQTTRIEFQLGPELKLSFLNELQARQDVVAVIPQMRNIANHLQILIQKNGKRQILEADAIATSTGDPIVTKSGLDSNLQNTEVFISSTVANQGNLTTGDSITLLVDRRFNGQYERHTQKFTVKGVINSNFEKRNAVLVTLPVNEAITDLRDGFDPIFFSDGSNLSPKRESYRAATIYVKDLYALEPMVNYLNSQGYKVTSNLYEVQSLTKIKETLDFIFIVIALSSLLCAVLVLVGFITSSIKRKLKTFALMRLIGFSNGQLKLMVVIEQLVIAILAMTCALGIYALCSYIFNLQFAVNLENNAVVSLLLPVHIVQGYVYSVFISVAVAFVAIYLTLGKFNVANTLREV